MLQYWQGIAPYLLRKNSEQTRSSYGAMPNKNRRVPLRIRCAELRIQNYELKIKNGRFGVIQQYSIVVPILPVHRLADPSPSADGSGGFIKKGLETRFRASKHNSTLRITGGDRVWKRERVPAKRTHKSAPDEKYTRSGIVHGPSDLWSERRRTPARNS